MAGGVIRIYLTPQYTVFHWPVVFGFYLMGQIVYWYSPCPVNIIPSLLDERVLYSVQRTLWTMTLKLWIMTLEWTSKGSHTPPLPSPPVDPVNNMSHYGLNQPMVHTHMYRSAEQQSVAADPVNTIRVSLARRRSRCPAFASAEHWAIVRWRLSSTGEREVAEKLFCCDSFPWSQLSQFRPRRSSPGHTRVNPLSTNGWDEEIFNHILVIARFCAVGHKMDSVF